jgi:hypothetical protein
MPKANRGPSSFDARRGIFWRPVPVVETMSDAGMVRCAYKGWAVIETAFNNANVTFIDAGDTTGGGAGVRFRS